jgi:hypothetical protein
VSRPCPGQSGPPVRRLASVPCALSSGRKTHQLARAWNADMASDPQVMWNFECPSCGAKYVKTKIEDQAENREGANCEHCLASFEPREGAYLFQYELIEHPSAGR